MHFNNLESLYNELIQHNQTRCVFTVMLNSKPFSCIFMIDVFPYRLYVTALGNHPFSLELNVENDFSAKVYLNNEDYRKLVNYLELKYDPDNHFSPTVLFKAVDNQMLSAHKSIPSYTDVLRHVRLHREIEESDKIYFCGWRNNPKNNTVSDNNYEKT